MSARYASVLGLCFGDCGKGLFVDALARRWQTGAVIRFNGGAQAGHNVVTSSSPGSPSRHHTFAQFGAGTFVSGVRTLLAHPMVLHPTALLVEAEALARIGIHDALSRLMIDAECRITTPFHQAAGRLRELLRGEAAHGTCGVGVGETVRHGLEHPDQRLSYSDLGQYSSPLLDRLQAIRETLLAEFLAQIPEKTTQGSNAEIQALRDETLAGRWLASACALTRHCPPLPVESIRRQLRQSGGIVFEGAQGVLLDEWRGFHPHTTWSTINTAAVEKAAARFGIKEPIEHYGVMRTYLTRHGTGPLPTHDPALDDLLPEPHNIGEGWQGAFRRGHPDGILLGYALEAAGSLNGLLVSHLDIFQRGISVKWCRRYSIDTGHRHASRHVDRLPLSVGEDLEHQTTLARLLQEVCPIYESKPIRTAGEFLERIAEVTSLPAVFGSHGATSSGVLENPREKVLDAGPK